MAAILDFTHKSMSKVRPHHYVGQCLPKNLIVETSGMNMF